MERHKRLFFAILFVFSASVLLHVLTSAPSCQLKDLHGVRDVRIQWRNTQWQVADGGQGRQLAARIALWDDRANVQRAPMVRVFAISLFQSNSVSGTNAVYCQFWLGDGTAGSQVLATVYETGRGARVAERPYQEKMYSCSVGGGNGDGESASAASAQPVAVSIGYFPCYALTTVLPIVRPVRAMMHELGVCTPVLYGANVHASRLIEWIELNRMLGVGEFNFYVSRLNAVAFSVVEHYAALGIVRYTNVTPPVPVEERWCYWCQKLAVIPTLNECLYRNMYRYKYIMLLDVDEVIQPRPSSSSSRMPSLLDMLATVDPTGYFKRYKFRNTYFFFDFKPLRYGGDDDDDDTYDLRNQLVTSTYVKHVLPNQHGYATKSIVNPRACQVLQNHVCMLETKDAGAKFSLRVEPSIARLHHYKKCHLEADKCAKMMAAASSGGERDDIMLRHTAELLARYSKHRQAVLKRLGASGGAGGPTTPIVVVGGGGGRRGGGGAIPPPPGPVLAT